MLLNNINILLNMCSCVNSACMQQLMHKCTYYMFKEAQKFKFGMCVLKMLCISFTVLLYVFVFTVVLTQCCTFVHFIIITKLPSGTLITALPYYFIYVFHT